MSTSTRFTKLRAATQATIDELEAQIHRSAIEAAIVRAELGAHERWTHDETRASLADLERCESRLRIERRVLAAIDDAEVETVKRNAISAQRTRERDARLADDAAALAETRANIDAGVSRILGRSPLDKAIDLAIELHQKGRLAELPAEAIATLRDGMSSSDYTDRQRQLATGAIALHRKVAPDAEVAA